MRGSAVATLALVAGCAPVAHVRLDVPAAEAPREERVAAYCALRPVVQHHGVHVPWAGSEGTFHDGGVTLADGRTVTSPADLVAATTPRSEAGRAVVLGEQDRDLSDILYGVGTGVGAVVLGGIVAGLVDNTADKELALLCMGGGAMVVVITSGARARMAARMQDRQAFDEYDASLRVRLGLTEEDLPPDACGEVPIEPPALDPVPASAWSQVAWDLDVDFNLGRYLPGPARGAFISRLRAGVAFYQPGMVWTAGATASVSNQQVIAFGGELEWSHLRSGMWGQVGGFADLADGAGGKVATGWSILGLEVQLRHRPDRAGQVTTGVFLKVRIPVSFFGVIGT